MSNFSFYKIVELEETSEVVCRNLLIRLKAALDINLEADLKNFAPDFSVKKIRTESIFAL